MNTIIIFFYGPRRYTTSCSDQVVDRSEKARFLETKTKEREAATTGTELGAAAEARLNRIGSLTDGLLIGPCFLFSFSF